MKRLRNGVGWCSFCQRTETADGHDPCIANLPGVVFACCGHGRLEVGTLTMVDEENHVTVEVKAPLNSCYVVFSDGLSLYGNAARAAMEILGGSPPEFPPDAYIPVPIWRVGTPYAQNDELDRLLRRRSALVTPA